MPFECRFSDPGEGISEGEVVTWLVAVGDKVEEHQAVVEVETDKAVVEIPTPESGTVLKLAAEEGDTIQVGDLLLVIGKEGETDAPLTENPSNDKVVSTLVGELVESEDTFEVVLAAPATRRLARKLSIDLKQVHGSGSGGRITEGDVRLFASRAGKQKAGSTGGEDEFGPVELIAVKGVRKATAKKMIKSFSTIPHVCHMDEADITELFEFRNSIKEELYLRGIKMTLMPFFIKTVLDALKKFPYFNSSYDGEIEEIRLKKYYNISIAIDTDRGLLTPVVKDVDKKNLIEIADEMNRLINRVTSKEIIHSELRGGSFTITNVGALGGIYSTPIINYPEVAILSTGKIRERPVAKKGKITVKKVIPLSLSFDHRVVDGADAVRFTNLIIRRLEDISWIDQSLFYDNAKN